MSLGSWRCTVPAHSLPAWGCPRDSTDDVIPSASPTPEPWDAKSYGRAGFPGLSQPQAAAGGQDGPIKPSA